MIAFVIDHMFLFRFELDGTGAEMVTYVAILAQVPCHRSLMMLATMMLMIVGGVSPLLAIDPWEPMPPIAEHGGCSVKLWLGR